MAERNVCMILVVLVLRIVAAVVVLVLASIVVFALEVGAA